MNSSVAKIVPAGEDKFGEHGVVLETKEISKQMAVLREQMTQKPPHSLER